VLRPLLVKFVLGGESGVGKFASAISSSKGEGVGIEGGSPWVTKEGGGFVMVLGKAKGWGVVWVSRGGLGGKKKSVGQ